MKNKLFGLFTLILVAVFFSCTVTETEYVNKIVEVEKKDTTPPASVSDDKIFVMAGDSAVLLSWTNPSDEDFYGTRVTFEPRANNVTQPIVIEGKSGATSSTCFNGLSNNVKYTFSLVALDKNQNESERCSKSSTPKSTADKTPPSAVTNPNSVAGNQKILLSWINPSDEDFYGVWISEKNGSGTLLNPVFLKSPAKSFVVSELENTVEYEFSIVALDGELNQSQPAQIFASPVDTSDKTPPAEAESLSVRAIDGNAVVTWSSPNDDDFLGVEVSVSPAVGTLAYPVLVRKDANSLFVSGLEISENYTFKVRTYDTSYNFSDGTTKNVTVDDSSDRTPPKKMTEANAIGSESKVVLSWQNPYDEDFFGVQISEKNNSGTLSFPVFIAKPATSFTISELTNGTEYEFSIVALDNSFNKSDAVTVTGTPVSSADVTVPMNVTGLTVSASDGNAVISWTNPNDADFAGVKISMAPAVGTLANPIEVSKTVTSISVSGLAVGETYTFTVQSFDTSKNYSNGVSKLASVSDTADYTPPDNVTIISASAVDGNALISWINPTDNDFAGVKISMAPAVGTLANPIEVSKTVTSISVSGLTVGSSYTFTIKSFDINKNYASGISESVTVSDTSDHTPPTKVTNENAACSDGKIILSWQNPVDEDFYGVQISEKNNSGTLSSPVFIASPATSFTVSELTNGTEYEFSILALDNSFNKSAAVTVKGKPVSSTDVTAPNDVSDLTVSASDGNAVISWTNPSDADFVGLKISLTPAIGTLANPVEVSKTVTSISVSGLMVGESYTFTVQTFDTSKNYSTGVSETTNVTDTADYTPPANVTNLTSTNKDGAILLTWTDATDTDAYGYEVIMNGFVYAVILQGTEKCFVSELVNGRNYSFTVKSIDANGNKSDGVTITATPEVIETSALKIELSTSEELSNTEITVTVKVTSASDIKRVVYKKNGSESPSKLLADSDALPCHKVDENDGTLWTFTADEKDYWTVAALDVAGREETAQIYTQTIDKTPPAEVTNVNSVYIKSLGAAEITWSDPADINKEYDSPFDHVLITYTKNTETEVHTVEETFQKGLCAGLISNIDANTEVYVFTIHTVDKLGNTSEGKITRLYTSNIVNATAADVVTKIDEMTQTGTVKLTGYVNNYTLSNINKAVCKKEFGITLDLSTATQEEILRSTVTNDALKNCTNLIGVIISASVTSIGNEAFYGCSNLTSVTLPASVTSIGDRAFYDCSNLTSVTIPASVTSIGEDSFYGCSSLTSVTLPASVTSIGDRAFLGCSSLTSVTLPASVTSIGKGAFLGCSSLTSVTLPTSVTSIGSSAFSGCSSLTSVTLPTSVTSIGSSAFENCGSLINISIPNSVISIGEKAFYKCTGLESVSIPSGVTKIEEYAFYNCKSLSSVTIPYGVNTIGDSAFAECYSLSNLNIPSTVSVIEEYAFCDCDLMEIFFSGSVEEWNSIEKGERWNRWAIIHNIKVICSDGEMDVKMEL